MEIHEPTLQQAVRAQRITQVLLDVGLPTDAEFLRRFPHQLSGGQQQRMLLALAFVLRPKVIVLDEPTTALDVTTQSHILATIRHLCASYGVAAIYVSHDLAVVKQLADQVIVLYAGRVVENAPAARLFSHPVHPYTRGLLAAIADIAVASTPEPIPGQAPSPGTRAHGCAFAPRCALRTSQCETTAPLLQQIESGHQAACLHLHAVQGLAPVRATTKQRREDARKDALLEVKNINAWYGSRQALFDVSLNLAAGECKALVGESGSGKTTLARILAGLGSEVTGSLAFDKSALALRARQRNPALRRQIQYIFQNPYRSLNPRHTVGETLKTTLQHFFPEERHYLDLRAANALEQVSLQAHLLHAYPRELSGGERQRVAIARALICQPRLLICDEVTSALDVSVQASIIELLHQLQAGGLAILFVTHNLGLVRSIADRVLVLRHGRVVERGFADDVLDYPQDAYTQSLIGDSPSMYEVKPPIQPPVTQDGISLSIPPVS